MPVMRAHRVVLAATQVQAVRAVLPAMAPAVLVGTLVKLETAVRAARVRQARQVMVVPRPERMAPPVAQAVRAVQVVRAAQGLRAGKV
jgi:hypothetical protein